MTVQTHHAAIGGRNVSRSTRLPHSARNRNSRAPHKNEKKAFEPRMLLIPFDLPEKSAPFIPLFAALCRNQMAGSHHFSDDSLYPALNRSTLQSQRTKGRFLAPAFPNRGTLPCRAPSHNEANAPRMTKLFVAALIALSLNAAEVQKGVVRSGTQPLPGATVTAECGTDRFTTVTGSAGEFELGGLPASSCRFFAGLFGFDEGKLEAAPSATALTFDLKLQPRATLPPDHTAPNQGKAQVAETATPPGPGRGGRGGFPGAGPGGFGRGGFGSGGFGRGRGAAPAGPAPVGQAPVGPAPLGLDTQQPPTTTDAT